MHAIKRELSCAISLKAKVDQEKRTLTFKLEAQNNDIAKRSKNESGLSAQAHALKKRVSELEQKLLSKTIVANEKDFLESKLKLHSKEIERLTQEKKRMDQRCLHFQSQVLHQSLNYRPTQ